MSSRIASFNDMKTIIICNIHITFRAESTWKSTNSQKKTVEELNKEHSQSKIAKNNECK